MPKKVALDLDDEEGGLNINKNYADRYNSWRGKEEKQKLKDRYGDVNLNSDPDESSSEEEDSAAELRLEDLDPETEREFLKTLASLKGKDPKIYDDSYSFFKARKEAEKKKVDPKTETMFLKDYDRKVILEKAGKLSDSDSEDEERMKREASPSFAQQQEDIKQSLKAALVKEEAEDGKDDILTKRVKSTAEQEAEEEEYIQWLKGQKSNLPDSEDKRALKPLREFWAESKDEGEQFLKEYILNRRYKEQGDDPAAIPTYDEITREEDADLSEDEEELEKAEEFEHKYNFRFEEPDPDFIKSYPRTIKDTLRRPDLKRKEARESYKDRKKREGDEARAEISELKAMKRREISEQIAKLKTISGDPDLPFDPKDLDGDFDPDEYDRRMKEIFSDSYYGAGAETDKKPEWGPDSDLDDAEPEDWDKWDDPEQPSTSSTSKPKPKKESEGEIRDLKEILKAPKPVFDPSEKTFAQYLEEYYALEAEGFAGGQPTRFRYRQVEANDFGLDVSEILTAPDKELNAWVSLKKACQYRSKAEEQFDKDAYQRKAQDLAKKKRVLQTVYKQPSAKRESSSDDSEDESSVPKPETPVATSEEPVSKKRRRKKAAKPSPEEGVKKAKMEGKKATGEVPESRKEDAAFTEDRLRAYGLNPKKFKNKKKYAN